jgi:hypothetical protein
MPPRDIGRRARARVLRVHVYGPWHGRVKATAMLAYPGHSQRSLLEFALGRRASGWCVTELYP